MSKPNLKSQAKRKRELAKLDKRQAKDQKRAERKAERAGPVDAVVVTPVAVAKPVLPQIGPRGAGPVAALAPAPAPKPLTLAAAALLWKNSKIVKAKAR
jgi:hypothetical protein